MIAAAASLLAPALALAGVVGSCAPAGNAAAPAATIGGRGLTDALDALGRRAVPAALGIAVLDLATGELTGVATDRSFPMQSVFKAPLGAAVLAAVDAGRLRLDQKLVLTRADLSAPYSPIADAWPGRTRYTVRELLELTVGGSDNTGADVLMRRIGGPAAVTRFLRARGVTGMRVDRYEREFQTQSAGMGPFRPAWVGEKAFVAARDAVPVARRRAALRAYLADRRDTATPRASVLFLRKLADGSLLSCASTDLLLGIMTRSGTGATRFKAGLPAGATLAHKTGSGRSDLGISPAANQIGLVTLPGGRRFAIAVYLAGSSAPENERDRFHAEAVRAAAAAFSRGGP